MVRTNLTDHAVAFPIFPPMSKTSVIREDGPEPSVSLDEVRRRKNVDALLATHRAYLEALARKLCQNQLDPDDLLQDLYEKLMTGRHQPERANERAWFGRVLHNLFIDKLRRKQTLREEVLEEPAIAAPEDDETWWQKLTLDQVRASIARLPDELRRTFELFELEHRSYEEIAAMLGIAKNTVGTRISRARDRLRRILTEEHGDG